LHDAVTQTLFSASLIAEVLPRIWEKDHQAGMERLEELRELTRGALAEMRTLLMELRPKSILETEFNELLEQLASAFSGRTRIPVSYQVENQGGLPDSVKVALYRILQESLNNIAKHARAEQVTIEVLLAEEKARVVIIDNGKGFDSESIPAESLGLGIMKERAREIGASFSLESKPGEGTSVSVVWQANKEMNHG
jgi:two-component system nitrate/nitrite sensor histidine kinase NarX